MIRFYSKKDADLPGDIQEDYLLLDETIWQEGREYFVKHRNADSIPVFNREHQLVCYAWQDEEANRELRMLKELEKCSEALDFHDLNPDYAGVVIHGCNELAWHFAQYLTKKGIAVNVDGEFWQAVGTWEEYEIPSSQYYEIWAEGVHQKSRDWKQERLRSASAEFECVDEIYEANIKAGKITDADGDVEDLLERLRKEKEIVIRGTGTKAQDAYDWLLANGIDICAFQLKKADKTRRSLFGKPIIQQTKIAERFKGAVIIECGSKHSAWGFKDVDTYDYEGYERNKRYFLLRDYIEVPENNLTHIIAGKNLIFVGDIRLCNRAYRWCKQQGMKLGEIGYWDILEENRDEIGNFQIPEIDGKKVTGDNIYLLLVPRYALELIITKETVEKYNVIIEKLKTYGIQDYTDYFSDMTKSIHLGTEDVKYNRKELCPSRILLGAIPGKSGNFLIKQSLAGHPQIILIEEYCFLSFDLYSICIRLAEEKADNILFDFWTMYQREIEPSASIFRQGKLISIAGDAIARDFPDKEKFHHKMEELLSLNDHFTSQELFVMFHIAYESMYGREISNLENMIIYWEPHQWNRKLVQEFAYWLGNREVKGFTLCTTRNRYISAGSSMATPSLSWKEMYGHMLGYAKKGDKIYENWEERTIKFEELKCSPKDILTSLCEWVGILFDDSLMETTMHGEKVFHPRSGITGFDIKPVYNLYEEYFSVFDRMRISILAGSYQKRYGYPYVSCLDFSRRELQEMFLKDFRWENDDSYEGKNEENVWNMQTSIRRQLWLERFAEIMKVELNEEY